MLALSVACDSKRENTHENNLDLPESNQPDTMKSLAITLALALAGVSTLPAATLISGTLADYLALDPTGGTIGTTRFSEFVLLPLQTGAELLSPDLILVNPIDSPGMPGLQFIINDSASEGDFFNIRFSYMVTDSALVGATIGIDDTSATFNSALTVIKDVDILGQQPETLIAFRTSGDSELGETTSFPSAASLAVTIDIALDGGGDGFTTLGSATSQFATIPEHLSLSTIAPLFSLLFLRRRR